MSSPFCFSLSNYRRKVSCRRNNNSNRPSLGIPDELCRRFSLGELKKATKNFGPDKVIGCGGFGTVYRGCIDDVDVAIKRSDPKSFQGREEFEKEVQLCCQLRHPNLVALKGLCEEQDEMILVSEYMPNSSLDNHLFGGDEQRLRLRLPWKQRLQICIDVARGLHYLHCGAKHAIIHRDVKSSNILLDGNWVAKLCDFGVSKVGPPSMSRSLIRVDSRVMGTYGYAEPEYIMSGELTEKSDVYSFGIVLFEALSGKRAIDLQSSKPHKLVKWVLKCLRHGTTDEMIEPYLKGKIAPLCLHKFVEIAASCVFTPRLERPAMGEVEVSLEDALELQETADSQNCTPHHTDYTYQYHDMSYLIKTTYDSESDSDTNLIS